MTLAIVPSLPAASMPCSTTRTECFASAHIRSWRLRRRSICWSVAATDDSLSWPNVAPASMRSRWTREPGFTRRASRSACERAIVSSDPAGKKQPGCTMATYPKGEHRMTVAAGTEPHKIFLAGRWVESPDVLEIVNPADPSTPAGWTYTATDAQYDEAVEAAVAAFEITRKLPAFERGRILREISAGIRARREELGRLIALESGKPIRDALVEVDRATLTFRLGAEEAERMTGELIPLDLMPA